MGDSAPSPSPGPGLLRDLGFQDLVAFGISAILGEGGFNLISKGVQAGGAAFPAALGGVGLLFQGASKVYSEAYTAFKSNTAESDVVAAELGKPASYASALLVFLFNILSVSTILVLTAKNILPAASFEKQIGFAAALLALMTGFALQGIRVNKQAVLGFTGAILALMGLASGVGLWEGFGHIGSGAAAWPAALSKPPNMLRAVLYFYFILAGFDDIIKFVKESRDPDRDVSRSFYAANAIALLAVVGVSYAYVHALTFKRDVHDNAIELVLESAFGAKVGNAVYWASIFLMVSTAFVSFLAVTRYLYSYAKVMQEEEEGDGPIPHAALSWFRDLNAARVPWRSILFSSVVALVFILINHVDVLVNLTDLSLSAIMVLVSGAVTRMIWRKGERVPWIEGLTTAGFAGLFGASFML